jgi:sec-independent protein translocase protein TatA
MHHGTWKLNDGLYNSLRFDMNISLPIAMLGLPNGGEIWLIGGVILLLFGGAKIPQLMRGLGQGVGELKKGLEEGKQAFTDASKDENASAGKPEEAGVK